MAVRSAAALLDLLAQPLVDRWNAGTAATRPRIPPRQLHVLLTVRGEGSVTLGTLGALLRATPSSTTRLCDRLQAAGLLVRVPGTVDRREVEVAVTAEGLRLLNRLQLAREQDLRTVLDGMSPHGRRALLTGLAAFADAAAGPRPARAEDGTA
ncbi:MarR family winged helix-turn-helix transcriptional regulator [Amycolatopsis suaedae]|uniref:MarR family transcriptional regulator n=1 Tax=Amycolatopsis suaedae TaxID=2510978 RepID=A0A4V2EL67_9PSEU|nr:MarR family transcriptional regulator [Amycolatopsis suaedae]RZQ60505.1 MarR family transcriptional regulator [Amycolatopsis suaedae]